jgi:hypothetical protein
MCYLQLRELKKAYEVFVKDVVNAKEVFKKNEFVTSFTRLLFEAISC